jgi:hypothetical protein
MRVVVFQTRPILFREMIEITRRVGQCQGMLKTSEELQRSVLVCLVLGYFEPASGLNLFFSRQNDDDPKIANGARAPDGKRF